MVYIVPNRIKIHQITILSDNSDRVMINHGIYGIWESPVTTSQEPPGTLLEPPPHLSDELVETLGIQLLARNGKGTGHGDLPGMGEILIFFWS